MSTSIDDSLKTEHDAIGDTLKDDDCNTEGVPYHEYIENFYVTGGSAKTEWNPIDGNLRFYRRRKGKQKGKFVAIYVNPKTGKGMKAPVYEYIRKIKEELLSDRALQYYGVESNIQRHVREHTIRKIMKRQRETIAMLKKEREKYVQ